MGAGRFFCAQIMSEVNVKGNQQERATFSECFRHYTMSREDLDKRIIDFDDSLREDS